MSEEDIPIIRRRLSVAAIKTDDGETHLAIEHEDGSVSVFHSRSNLQDENFEGMFIQNNKERSDSKKTKEKQKQSQTRSSDQKMSCVTFFWGQNFPPFPISSFHLVYLYHHYRVIINS